MSSRTATVFLTDLGWITLEWDLAGMLTRLRFAQSDPAEAHRQLGGDVEVLDRLSAAQRRLVRRIKRYASGKPDDFLDVELPTGELTEFQQRVTRACRQIPPGRTRSYGELAAAAGTPRAARAVGNVMRANRWPLIVPCHRVIASGGIGGFSARGGLDTKRRLLKLEGIAVE